MFDIPLLASSNPIAHVVDHQYQTYGEGFFSFSPLSNHIIMQLTAAALLLLIIPAAVRRRSSGSVTDDLTPRGARNFFETICNFIRENVARPALGEYTDTFIPYLWTVFFFILFTNLLGLLPIPSVTKYLFGMEIGGTATGNLWTTGTLAICTLVMVVANGLKTNGMTYVKHFFMGPFPINILIALCEVIGLAAKTAALAIRLFANMIAGHILLAVLLSFIGLAAASSVMTGTLVSIPVVLGSVAINLLELFVAFLQAFIFTFLTTIFIGQAVVIHHDHHDEHEVAHGHEHGETAHGH